MNYFSAFKHVLNLQLVVDIKVYVYKASIHFFFKIIWVLCNPCLVSAPNWSCRVIFQILRMVELHPYLFPSTWFWAQAGAYTHTPVDALADESVDASACTWWCSCCMIWYELLWYVWTAVVWHGRYESACCWCTCCLLMQMRWATETPTLPVSSIGIQPILSQQSANTEHTNILVTLLSAKVSPPTCLNPAK